MDTGFFDPLFRDERSEIREQWLTNAAKLDARVLRMTAPWSLIAPVDPGSGFDATNPDDPGYRWEALDAAVEDASGRGLRLLLTLENAPLWAQGDDRPTAGDNENWKVDPRALGDFATAIGRRYSGEHVRPGTARPLPRVRYWQIWNEPNLYAHLNPQWIRDGDRWRPFAPSHYRAMLNAAYRSLHGVAESNVVLTAGTGPFGDLRRGERRIPPAQFWRMMVCVDRRDPCDGTVRFDVAAHHPYSVRGPHASALNADDVSVPDLDRIRAAIDEGVKAGTVAPGRNKPLWVTEIAWDSAPDPDAVSQAKQARWLSGAMEELAAAGVSTVLWLRIADEPPKPSYPATSQSGVFELDGTPKPAARAFRFPSVSRRDAEGAVRIWALAPRRGAVLVERRTRRGWSLAKRVSTRPGRTMVARIGGLPRGVDLRVRQNRVTSLTMRVP